MNYDLTDGWNVGHLRHEGCFCIICDLALLLGEYRNI